MLCFYERRGEPFLRKAANHTKRPSLQVSFRCSDTEFIDVHLQVSETQCQNRAEWIGSRHSVFSRANRECEYNTSRTVREYSLKVCYSTFNSKTHPRRRAQVSLITVFGEDCCSVNVTVKRHVRVSDVMQQNVRQRCSVASLTVMPKFELVIDPPRYIRDLSSCEQATVRAR